MMKKFTKSDLEDRMVVEYRNGEYVLCSDEDEKLED